MEKLIGRENEAKELERSLKSDRSEFVVVYGRRRVGKTFLIRKFFNDTYTFQYVGAHKASKQEQLSNFKKAINKYFGDNSSSDISSWPEAFSALEKNLEQLDKRKRKVIFFDEMPWIDNKRSGFVAALEYFWNSWVMGRDDIVLIACGSATSWMIDKLVENKGGLRGRITKRIYLHPFTLHECKAYLESRNFDWDEYIILQNYMVMGGIPYYLSLLNPKLSLQQNIDYLFFKKGSMLKDEFQELYNALFNKADRYIAIVKALSEHKEGMTRKEIEVKTKVSGGELTKLLANLENCDFITAHNHIGRKVKDTIFRLVDFYTLFYFKFIAHNRTNDEDFWMHNFQSRSVETWEGLSFELVCLLHQFQIKHALGISGISTEISTWRCKGEGQKKGSQIDLIIKRVDKITHLCEMKFCDKKYTITSSYEQQLQQRKALFCDNTNIMRGVVHTFITPYGINQGKHSSIVHSEVTAKDLFWD